MAIFLDWWSLLNGGSDTHTWLTLIFISGYHARPSHVGSIHTLATIAKIIQCRWATTALILWALLGEVFLRSTLVALEWLAVWSFRITRPSMAAARSVAVLSPLFATLSNVGFCHFDVR